MLILAGFAASTPARAAGDWLDGEWCDAKGGERLFVDGGSIGLNEHTICEWSDDARHGSTVDTSISCANVYVNGDETVRMDQRTVRIHASQIKNSVLVATPDGAEILFERCG